MRACFAIALLILASCQSGPRDPQAERVAQIRLHCMSAGPLAQGPQYGYNTQQGIITGNPGGFMQGYAAGQAKSHAERECLRSYGMWP